MKIKTWQILLVVSFLMVTIITQIRERMTERQPAESLHASACALARPGLAAASCNATRGERSLEGTV